MYEHRAGDGAASLRVAQVKAMEDNFIYVGQVTQADEQFTFCVDPGEAQPVLPVLETLGWSLDAVLCTHHHHDHIGGVAELTERTGCAQVYGPQRSADKVAGLTCAFVEGEGELDLVREGGSLALRVETMHTPGHTLDHACLFLPSFEVIFSADTLFALGCGRLFEGTPEQMVSSLDRLAQLPESSAVYCAHEYTLTNAEFAQSIDEHNAVLQDRVDEDKAALASGFPTVPSSLARELATNPFLARPSEACKLAMGLPEQSTRLEEFTLIRSLRDKW